LDAELCAITFLHYLFKLEIKVGTALLPPTTLKQFLTLLSFVCTTRGSQQQSDPQPTTNLSPLPGRLSQRARSVQAVCFHWPAVPLLFLEPSRQCSSLLCRSRTRSSFG